MRSFFLHTGLAGLFKLLHDKKIAFAAVIYFLVCGIAIYKFGINTNGEAAKYIDDAQRILNGESLRAGFLSIFYIAYSLLISFFLYFSITLQAIAWLQILLSFVAACCIYKLLFEITADNRISFAAFIIYLICFPVQKWNFFLYTESIHTSFITAGLYFFYCVFQKRETKRWWILLIVLLLIIFSRPVGMIFLLAGLIVAIIIFIKSHRKIVYYSIGLCFIIVCIFLLQSQFAIYFNPDSLRRMEIICQVPQANTALDYKEYNASGLTSFFHVIYAEIGIKTFLLNGVKKVISFFGMVRSFYSTGHNIILFSTGIIMYPIAILGLFFLKNKNAFLVKSFSIIYIFLTSIGIFFTCDEWSNRFIAPVLPFIVILFGLGLCWLKNKWIGKVESKI